MKIQNSKFKIIFIIIVVFVGYSVLTFFQAPSSELDFNAQKSISINDNGLMFSASAYSKTVADLLQEKKIVLGEHDAIVPAKDSVIYPGMHTNIYRAIKIRISADGETREFFT